MPALGWRPRTDIDVNLGRDTDFVQTVRRNDGSDWPPGAVVTLKIGTTASWTATLSGPAASWNVDKTLGNAVCDALFDQNVTIVATYTDASGLDLVWFRGKVAWFG